jgi:hypothetical protein
MSDGKSLLDEYLDGLSVKEARELIRQLLTVYESRPGGAPNGEKSATRTNTARAAQKALAEVLARTDADWIVRESVLNLGRVAYYSTNPPHSYYRQGLIDLVQRAADKIGQSAQGREFDAAVKRHEKLVADAGGAVFAVGEILESNNVVVGMASKIVTDALDKFGASIFTRSEGKMLTGVVTPAAARRLNEA